jgi:hypothetical protein
MYVQEYSEFSFEMDLTLWRYSQPKRELFGLKRALRSMQYWLLGCRKLVVETDAQYLKGMLEHSGMGPNAAINRRIEEMLMSIFN